MSAPKPDAFDALYVPADHAPFFPYGNGTEVRLIEANPITGVFMVELRGLAGTGLGIHHHYGSVVAYTLQGAWGYREHDWTARTGDVVHEVPGSTHTLDIRGETGEEARIFFMVDGALEFIDDAGNSIEIEDWRSITQKYWDYCAREGIQPKDVSGKAPGRGTMPARAAE